jgi:hypothetical protein
VLGALPSVFVGHLTKKPLSSGALGKALLSVTTAFAESRTLDTGTHSAKIPLPSAKHSPKRVSRQRTVSRCLKLTVVIFAESRVLALGKESSFSSAPLLTLDKDPDNGTRWWILCRVSPRTLGKATVSVTAAFLCRVPSGTRQRLYRVHDKKYSVKKSLSMYCSSSPLCKDFAECFSGRHSTKRPIPVVRGSNEL